MPATLPDKKYSLTEKILLSFSAILILTLISLGIYLVAEVPKGADRALTVNYPIKGKFIQIESINTTWTEINWGAEGKRQWRPEITITLSPDTQYNGGLRIMFKNGQGQNMGDTDSLEIKNGVFVKTNTKEASIMASRGIIGEAHIAEYIGTDIPLWTALINEWSPEAPSENIPLKRISLIPHISSFITPS